ncbi:PBECR2 nuclease fold domain-containing protein [Clostridium cylindrosporum]|uniref:Phage-Barnase-EndoU-ColicinE5/D-RelE like nuclease 3 domain-containing protein n=1 Tax=Clostridium cylindrosporum DSM 605 TaxID=1121307 RepID=A0A0J8D6A6_CLOCY|nr:PBECR2 nuclease fold domain-containing protein [Clostridium cylindrosporum]KMT21625.1 hypothetical protein CLCY_2c03870 [Clostridium cylindrosporum DSM 605]
MSKNLNSYYWVGKISSNMGRIVNFNYTGVVYMSSGVMRHILKKHRSQLSKKNLHDPIGCIKRVIKNPDYIGTHPDKQGTSMEFVKCIHDNHILVAVDVDKEDGYIYISSMYPITDAKLESRICSGRFKKAIIR